MALNTTLMLCLEPCARCGEPILPGEPYVQRASVDIVDGRAVASPARSYHGKGGCYQAAKQEEWAAIAARASIAA